MLELRLNPFTSISAISTHFCFEIILLYCANFTCNLFKARARIEQYEKRLVQAQQENDHYKQTLDEVKVNVNIYAFFIALRRYLLVYV